MERRLTTILAADIAGYSRLMAADEEGVVERLHSLRKSIIDPALAEHGGRVVKTMGDGLLVEFASPVEAVRAALVVQKAVNSGEATRPEDDRMQFRTGVHFGDVLVDGDDLLGDVVNVAARLETLSPVGGVCVSRSVREMIGGKVEADLTDLGPQMVKNIPEPVEVWRVEVDGAVAAAHSNRAVSPSIAVLPFSSKSDDLDDAFLSEGLVEDVTTELGRFRALTVIARASNKGFDETAGDTEAIGRALGARYLVQGSVRRAGGRLRVSAQLIEAGTGVQLWSERWDRDAADLFDLQDELTGAIVNAVEPELGAHERALTRRKPTESLTAWELCQRGLMAFLTFSDEGYVRARQALTRAIEADPEFALPHAHMARLCWSQVSLGRTSDVAGTLEEGLAYARRAVELDRRLEAGYHPLATLSAAAGLYEDAVAAAERGLAINPNNALLHHARAVVNFWAPDPDPDFMVASELEALRLNPNDPHSWSYHMVISTAEMIRTGSAKDASKGGHLDMACRYENADYVPFMINAVVHMAKGRQDVAARFLHEAMNRNRALSLEIWKTAFTFPVWPKLYAAQEAELAGLVELGLPRE